MNRPNQSSVLALCFLLHLLCTAAEPLKPAQAKLATEAHQVLINYCGKCHGKGGSYSDEMLLDYTELVGGDEPVVVKGKAGESYLYETIADGDMPPKKAKNPIPADKLALIKQWIEGGAPDWNLAPQQKREFVSMDSVIDSIVKDLQKLPRRKRQFVRYYTLTHLHNAGESEDALGNYRIALSKLVNSLSWESTITNPVTVDPKKTILRLDLRDYGWTKDIWKKITANYPYAVNYPTKNYESLRNLAAADVPFLRTDWFISTAGLPPLYHDILELPNTDKELEDKLNVDVRRNLRDSPGRRVWRSGFLKSGVSKFNRIVERHTSPYGAYWKSYDFDSNKGLKNIFQNPIGFKHAGGEIIFNLPNGLQGYLLADSSGRRINEAPVDIVFSTQGSDPIIRNGLTCMSCHTSGMKEFKDRAGDLHLAIQNTAFDVPDEKDYALDLYPDAKTINKLVDRDKQKFEEAVTKLGGVAGGKEPIALLTDRYEEPLDSKLTAAELGITEAVFSLKLRGSRHMADGLNTLVAGGTIAREAWEEQFQEKDANFFGQLLILCNKTDLAHFREGGFSKSTFPENWLQAVNLLQIKTKYNLHVSGHLIWTIDWRGSPAVVYGLAPFKTIPPGRNKPVMITPVKKGTVQIGKKLAAIHGVKRGETVKIEQRDFEVARLLTEKGNDAEIRIYMHLADAQSVLQREGHINQIQIIDMDTAGRDIMALLQEQLRRILPQALVF